MVIPFSKRSFQEIVQSAFTPASTQVMPRHLEPVIGEALAGGQELLMGTQMLGDAGSQRSIFREPAVVFLITFSHAVEGVLIHVIDSGADRGQACGNPRIT